MAHIDYIYHMLACSDHCWVRVWRIVSKAEDDSCFLSCLHVSRAAPFLLL